MQRVPHRQRGDRVQIDGITPDLTNKAYDNLIMFIRLIQTAHQNRLRCIVPRTLRERAR